MAKVALPVRPTEPTSASSQPEAKLVATVRENVVELVKPPTVPVTVTAKIPAGIVPPAVRVSVLEAGVGFGLKEALTPLGRPEADKVTLLVKPFSGFTAIELVTLVPGIMLKLLGEAERVKFPTTVTESLIGVELVRLPDVPVSVRFATPVVAVLLAVRVRTLEVVAGFWLNDAVTPLGKPETDKMMFPAKPFC